MCRARPGRGSLVTVPLATGDLAATISEAYRDLLEDHDADDVLVLTASPTSAETIGDVLADDVPGAAVPRVASIVVQATDVVERTDDRTVLSDALRRELVTRFLRDREWDAPYLQRAAEQPSFVEAVGQLMETATWQQTSFDATPELVEIRDALDAFHDWLDEHDHLERGQLVTAATDALRDDAQAASVDATAVLAVEFEEYFAPDRRFLRALSEGRDLVCVAEEDASIRRTRMESGPVAEQESFASTRRSDEGDPATRPAAVAAYLARGDVHEDPGSGAVDVLTASTPDEQLERVADEIEQLRDERGWDYDDVAVVTRRSGAGLPETIRSLEGHGLPTESTSVLGFGDDPAVRELLRVVRALRAPPEERERLCDGDPVLDASRLEALAAMDGLADPLRRWATESGLKARVAEETHPLDVRAQFGNVSRVFGMAAFVEETDFLQTTWDSVAELLERAHEYAPRENQTSATERDGGVRVDHVRALGNADYRAVFLVDVVDETYPGDPQISALFPSARVAEMPDYPGVTAPTGDDVAATFATESTAASRPLRRYYVEQARRELAVGAAAATDRLYCCLYEYGDSALEERVQPSRFLRSAFLEVPWLTDAGTEGREERNGETSDDGAGRAIQSERSAEAYALSRVDRALADVRRCASRDVTVSLDDVERDLAEIQALLDESGDRGERLRDALRARVDVTRGRIRRE